MVDRSMTIRIRLVAMAVLVAVSLPVGLSAKRELPGGLVWSW